MKKPEIAQVGDEMHFTSSDLPLAEIEVGIVNRVLDDPLRWCVTTPSSPAVIVNECQVVEVRISEDPAPQIQDARPAAGLGGKHRPSTKKIMSGWTW